MQILDYTIPNTLDELTIQQFEQITTINNDTELDPVDKHLKIFELLGIPQATFDNMDIADFIEITKQFNSLESIEYPTVDTLEIEGYTYKAELKLTVRDTKLIEKIAIHKEKGYISDMLAVFFKRVDLSPIEHYTDAHLKTKAKLMAKLKAHICIPYIVFIGQKISAQVEDTKPVE